MGCFPSLYISTSPMFASVVFVRSSLVLRCFFTFSSVTFSLMLRIFMLNLAFCIKLLCCSMNAESPFVVFPLSSVITLFSKSSIFPTIRVLSFLVSFACACVTLRIVSIILCSLSLDSLCSIFISSWRISSLSSLSVILSDFFTLGECPFLSFFRLTL